MTLFENPLQWLLGFILILTSIGVITAKKPVYACLFFLLTLLVLAILFLQLSAQFIAVMQVLIYAGAILVIFMFVIILFQDAYLQIDSIEPKSSKFLITGASVAFILANCFIAYKLLGHFRQNQSLPEGFGYIDSLGKTLYLDFFFPFEAVILLFLVAAVGALYVGKKEL